MRKAGSLSQEQPQQPLAGDEQPAQKSTAPVASAAASGATAITCALCNASFALEQEREDDWKMDAAEVEAAFMSICHFCFRCRRAACPECWDPVYRVCAQCVAWAGLPFRSEPSPLADMVFPPEHSPRQMLDESIVPFVCVRHGRYQSTESAATDPEAGHGQQTATTLPRKGTMPVLPSDKDERAVELSQSVLPIVAPPAKKTAQITKQAEDEPECEPSRSVFKIIERVLTIIALAILLVVIVLIVLAEVSARANGEIVRFLHVDIRAEVAYLIVLVKQIHW